MSQIQFKRDKAWQDKMRDYRILIDDKQAASIGEQAEVNIPVSPGKHIVQLTVDWCTSQKLEVDVEQGKTQIIACGPNSSPLLALLFITLWRKKYIWIKHVPVNA